jgi:hypothetical protein
MEFKYNIPEQLEVNSKLVIRSQELEVLPRTHKEKKFYYINGGRDLLIKTNLITRESPYIHRTENTPFGCKEDEFNLVHKFSQSDLPVWLIDNNPIVADSLDNLMKYINYITEVSKTIPESKEEKQTRKRNKLRSELNMGMNMGIGIDPMMGMLSMMEKITKLEKKTKKLKKEILILKNK